MPHHKKKTYKSRGACFSACLRAARRTGIPMRPYWCREHQAWEMTKQAKR